MTPNKVMEHVDSVRPNAYSEEDKFRWINELDGMVQKLVFQCEEPKSYTYPDDMDTPLLIPHPFEGVYALYVEAMIDFHNREYANYNNSAQMFSTKFNEYQKAYIRAHMPKSAGGFQW